MEYHTTYNMKTVRVKKSQTSVKRHETKRQG